LAPAPVNEHGSPHNNCQTLLLWPIGQSLVGSARIHQTSLFGYGKGVVNLNAKAPQPKQ
jgi:hypothetical protein